MLDKEIKWKLQKGGLSNDVYEKKCYFIVDCGYQELMCCDLSNLYTSHSSVFIAILHFCYTQHPMASQCD